MSKQSKNSPVPISSMMRRWKVEMGRRSRRAPESAVTASSLLPREQSQAAFCQGIDGETTILIEGVLLGVKKEVFTTAYRGRVEPQDALDESVGFGRKPIGGTHLRDQAQLLRAMRVAGLAKHDQGKNEPGKPGFPPKGPTNHQRQPRKHPPHT